MPTVTFKVSDSQKHSFLWTLLNPNYNEAGNWTVEYGICEIYEDYAIVMNYAENKYERIYYAKNDEADSLEITNREDCYIIDVSSAEKEALARLRSLNSDTYEAVDEKFEKLSEEVLTATESLQGLTTELETVKEENSQFEIKIEELGNQIATLNTEKETANSDLVAVTNRLTEVAAERDELATYKKNIMDTEKRNLINDYSDQLDQTVLDEYLNNLDGYTLKQLDMELTYQVKVCRPEIFSKNPASTVYIPKDTTPVLGALETLLSKYERK